MSTLAFKFGTLLLKQLSKPVAARVKEFVLKHPTWRKRTLDLSRRVHRWEVWATQTARTDGKKVVVGEMVDDKAIELASSMVSETVIFTIAATLLMWEYNRSSVAAAKKLQVEDRKREELQRVSQQQRDALKQENEEQFKIMSELQLRVEKLEQLIKAQQQESRQGWWKKSNGASIVANLDPLAPEGKAKSD